MGEEFGEGWILVCVWLSPFSIHLKLTTLLIGNTLIQKKKKNVGRVQLNFPGGPVVRTLCFHYKGTGLLPGWGARIQHACHVVGQISGWMEHSSVRKSGLPGCSRTPEHTWSRAVAADWAPFSEDLLGCLSPTACWVSLALTLVFYVFLHWGRRGLTILCPHQVHGL